MTEQNPDPKLYWHYDVNLLTLARRLMRMIPTGWLANSSMKYLNLRIDMRTGAWCVFTRDFQTVIPKAVVETSFAVMETKNGYKVPPPSTEGIRYLKGDATRPQGTNIIVHVCNDRGAWGAGFVMALSKRWHAPELLYRHWHKGDGEIGNVTGPFRQGEVQFIAVYDSIVVANMIAQTLGGERPLNDNALRACLEKVADFAVERKASVHMPRIGCGLAGGKWEEVEPIINETLVYAGVPVTVYDL